MSNDPFRQQIAAAVHALSQGDTAAGEAILRAVLAHGEHPVALYVLAMAACEHEAWPQAEALLRRAHRLSPGEPRLNLALARAIRMQGRPQEAIVFCQAALNAMPGDDSAALELARAQEESGAWADAEASYRRILARGLEPTALVNLGRMLTADGRADEAGRLLENALAGSVPDPISRASLNHQLGLTRKFQRRFPDALALMDQAQALDPRPDRARMLDRAALLRHLGRGAEEVEAYREILKSDPLDTATHILLNESLLAQKRESEFLSSYDLALRQRPDPKLSVGKGQMLIRLEKAEAAQTAFRDALILAPKNSTALAGLGRALEMQGETGAAEAAHRDSLKVAPDDGATLEAFGNFLLRQGEAKDALALAERARRVRPTAQGAVALQGLCWRALGDERDAWLNDYERHVQVFDLEPPLGHADMDDFNRELARYLSGLHDEAQQYLTQTLRGGTQTHEEVFHNGHGLVDSLMPRINEAVRAYAQRLAARGDHPLVSRRSNGVRYAGSWSSCLGDRGFHVNHIHQMGWISSCYYVALPDAIEDGQQGWIRFGEAPAEFAGRFAPMRAVKPRPGRLVLFPSYMWHGTVPFHADQKRVTIAFDAVPA